MPRSRHLGLPEKAKAQAFVVMTGFVDSLNAVQDTDAAYFGYVHSYIKAE
jgi:hypothetical protein